MKNGHRELNGDFCCIEHNKKIRPSTNKIKSFHILLVKVIRLACGKLYFEIVFQFIPVSWRSSNYQRHSRIEIFRIKMRPFQQSLQLPYNLQCIPQRYRENNGEKGREWERNIKKACRLKLPHKAGFSSFGIFYRSIQSIHTQHI